MWNWLTGRLASARAVRVARLVPAWAVDLALAAGLAAAMIAERVAAPLPGNRQSLAIALSLVIAAALALRRRLPLAAYLAGSAALVAGALWAVPSAVAPYANLIGVYSLGELDHMLGVLRDDRPAGGGDCLTMPGIADLPGLAERMTEAGVRVTVYLDPPSPRLSRGVDLSAYRIIQEALTNSMKHGGARSASVTVRLDGPWLGIEVCDDGRGAAAGYLPGRGLLGVGERVAAFGGSLQHGSSDRGGFRPRATLPAP